MEQADIDLDDARDAASACCRALNADVFFYNGSVVRSNVWRVMEEIAINKSSNSILLLLVTYGGDPHAAFKICRYIQDSYEKFTLFVPGFCKSAGTLFAIAAHEVVFAPFGELGPLDVQMAKPDHFQYDSGLVIGESLETLERRAAQTFKRMFEEVIAEQQGLISINSALNAASELTKAIYSPIMARVDPEEIGARQRALRIALDYGERLAARSANADRRAVTLLAEKYSSHDFVIDKTEARELFRNVRAASPEEMDLASSLGILSRIERHGNPSPIFKVLSKGEGVVSTPKVREEQHNAPPKRKRDQAKDEGASSRANGAAVAEAHEPD